MQSELQYKPLVFGQFSCTFAHLWHPNFSFSFCNFISTHPVISQLFLIPIPKPKYKCFSKFFKNRKQPSVFNVADFSIILLQIEDQILKFHELSILRIPFDIRFCLPLNYWSVLRWGTWRPHNVDPSWYYLCTSESPWPSPGQPSQTPTSSPSPEWWWSGSSLGCKESRKPFLVMEIQPV